MRGIVLSKEERESALTFFAGKQVPKGMGKGSMQWLADELLTVLRLQQSPQEGLAAESAKVAFQPRTDPVVRDYIMQHLGHLWEQYGAREEIEKSLWRAVASSDETTPGTALIALSRGYQRDQQEKSLEKVLLQAFALAQNPATGLAVRISALSIAGEGGDAAVKELANSLTQDPATPVILKKVAEHVVQHVP
jgi:lipopolysaccharide biosynthesis regulator YciM